MSYFFSDQHLTSGDHIEISGDEAHHILNVRRIKVGESIKLQDPEKKRFRAEIEEVNRKTIRVLIHEEVTVPREPRIHIHLFQATTKEKTVDIILQKGTELGVEAVHFFESENSPYTIAHARAEKLLRWESIVTESAKQCERASWPTIDIINSTKELEVAVRAMDHFYIIDSRGRKSLSHMASNIPKLLGLSIGICIGPEGRLRDNELDFFAKESNTVMAHLGPRTLRASTAAPAAIALIQSIMGDMQ